MDHDQQPMRRSSGRRKAKGSGDAKKSKQPRRGMGVAKLERLIEQGEVITETDRPGFQLPAYHHLYSYGQTWNPVGFPGFYGLVGSDRRLHQLGSYSDFGVKNSDENVVKCYSLHCNACHKKKKINGDQNVLNQERSQNLGNYGNKVEVVAVHRRGASSNWDGGSHQRVLMEYDFFPAAAAEADGGNEGDGLVGDSTVGGFDGSNCVDLSLKLSY